MVVTAIDKVAKTARVTGLVCPFVAPWREPSAEARIGFVVKAGDCVPRVDAVSDWAFGSGEAVVSRDVPVDSATAKEDFLVVMDRLLVQGPNAVVAVIPVQAVHKAAETRNFEALGVPEKIMRDVEFKRWSNTIRCVENFGLWTDPGGLKDVNAKGFHDSARAIVFTARMVFDGDNYGLDDCLTHQGEPMVEFYDQRYKHTDRGQFVSRYYVETLFSSTDPEKIHAKSGGLCLNGGVNSWALTENTMQQVALWTAGRIAQKMDQTAFDAPGF